MRLAKRVFVGLLCASFLLNYTIPVKADGALLFNTSIFCDTSDEGCNAEDLKTASFICVNKLSEEGLQKVLTNPNLEQIQIADITNLPVEEVAKLYPYLCKDNIEYSAILLAYENIKDSVGNDGTPVYVSAVDDYAPDSSAYYRSCATTVSVILNAAGYVDDYSSAGCSGLVNYFETHPDEWTNMGRLSSDQMQEGDVIFIDRQSHKADYIKGILSDDDLDLTELINTVAALEEENAETMDLGDDGDEDDSIWWDENGNYHMSENEDFGYYTPDGEWIGYENGEGWFTEYGELVPFTEAEQASKVTKPKGGVNDVFNPDSNGDGVIDYDETQHWNEYWLEKTGEIPSFDYYETWKKEADEYKNKASEALNTLDENTIKKLAGKSLIIHNHIILWLGNDVIQKYYPESTGNIISGSYSEAYGRARSAAVSSFNFTGDYRIYRHK